LRLWLIFGAGAGLSGVALGAFGAHGLQGHIPAADFANFQTAVQYHLIHALALLAADGMLARGLDVTWAACFFGLGLLLFCGALYVLAITGSRALVMLAPLGGLSFMAGWAVIAWAAWTERTAKNDSQD